MLNAAINRLTAFLLRRKMRTYERYPAGRTALLILDTEPALLAKQEALILKLRQLTGFARANAIPVIFSSVGGERPDMALPPGLHSFYDLIETHKASKEAGALHQSPEDTIWPPRKTLSCFQDEKLVTHLKDTGIEHIVIAGACADLSVDSSARHATELGFHTTVLSDCCGGTSPEAGRTTIEITLPRMVHSVITFDTWQQHIETAGSGG